MSTDTSFAARSHEENWLPVLELAVEEVFEIMLGCRVKPVAQAEHPPNAEFTAMIGLAGALCGILTVCCSAKTAGQIATKMLGDAATSESEVSDALGEVCNMIAGNFESGSARMMATSEAALDRIARMLGKRDYRLRIEGYTDNAPIHTAQFPSNWELSTSRATEIVRVFIVREGFSPDHLSAAGYGEYHPLASNLTAEGRSTNRRVDIVILSRDSAPASASPSASQASAPAGIPNAGPEANKATPTSSPATLKPTAGIPVGEHLQQ